MSNFQEAVRDWRSAMACKKAEEIVKRISTIGAVPKRAPNDPKGLPPVPAAGTTEVAPDSTLGGEKVQDAGFATPQIIAGTGTGPAFGNDDMTTTRS